MLPIESNLPNLVLAGFMGTGKSTVGPLVARKLNMPYVDTDHLIEECAKLGVSEIFAQYGEPAFRDMEREACRTVATYRNHVISVGGGALLDPSNRAALESTGVLVLLTCEQTVLIKRLQESARRGERPLLANDFEETVGRLLKAREPVYQAIEHRVDTTNLTPEQVADSLIKLYRGLAAHTLQAGVP
jgi:shikimate kinase